LIEIRWHGRGGQGAKTASLLMADVAFMTGMYVQGFPEYGPERMGAPITAYNRLSTEKITVHSNIYAPGVVIVVDESLIESVDVTSGLNDEGAIIVNSRRSPGEILDDLESYNGAVYTVDARTISLDAIGKNLPNTPLLAAAIKICGIMNKEEFFRNMRSSFAHKFSLKKDVIEGNLAAIHRAWEEVECS